MGQQTFDSLRSDLSCSMQWSFAIVISVINIGTKLKQEFNDFVLIVRCGPVDWSLPLVRTVDQCWVVRKHLLNCRDIALQNSVFQARLHMSPLHGSEDLEASHFTSYVILPCFCDLEIRSPAYSPARTNSTHEARTASFSPGLTSKALSQARGTRFKRSA